jgi:hypothetical protein
MSLTLFSTISSNNIGVSSKKMISLPSGPILFKSDCSTNTLFLIDAFNYTTNVLSGNQTYGGVGESILTKTISNTYPIANFQGDYVLTGAFGNPYATPPTATSTGNVAHAFKEGDNSIKYALSGSTTVDISGSTTVEKYAYFTIKFPSDVLLKAKKFNMILYASNEGGNAHATCAIDGYNGTSWEQKICNLLTVKSYHYNNFIHHNLVFNTASDTITGQNVPSTTMFNAYRIRFLPYAADPAISLINPHFTCMGLSGDWYKS